MKILSKCCL